MTMKEKSTEFIPPQLMRIIEVRPMEPPWVWVRFHNGEEREINLEPHLRGQMFEPVRNDPDFFRQVLIEGITIAWPNGADLCPDVLYYFT